MLWKPAALVYPKLIQDAPGGLTKDEADELRRNGKNLNGEFDGALEEMTSDQGLQPHWIPEFLRLEY
ncbi:hypothetical protein JHK82_050323 [Glycine max]|nr:hypothetical protein JHK85_050958 [Glycine max]KAG5091545.1 hypothetical protein JHK82_050323 [Glycine max]KAG5094638.1 hypothetical protein JHK84_050226 [Glycine max]